MTDAPERIWACASKNSKSGVITLLGNAAFPVAGWHEYIRADAAEAKLKAILEADAQIWAADAADMVRQIPKDGA